MDPRDVGRRYVATEAWRRAVAYAVASLGLAWATGAMAWVLRDTAVPTGAWLGWALTGWLVVVIGYGVLWPRGTYVEDRPARPVLQVGFGVGWGLAQGLLFLSAFRIVDRLPLPAAVAGVLGFCVVATWQALWHDRWWDRHVAPPHNLVAWNPVKVAACHVPNLAISTVLLVRWGDARLFLALQVLALTFSAVAMRFPAPGYVRVPRGPGPADD